MCASGYYRYVLWHVLSGNVYLYMNFTIVLFNASHLNQARIYSVAFDLNQARIRSVAFDNEACHCIIEGHLTWAMNCY